MDYRLYDMSEPHSDIGAVSLWGPGQALCFKTMAASSCSTPTTPSYSQTLDLETRMLDGSTMVAIPAAAHVSPLQTTVISTGPAADHCRHVVCPPTGRSELQIPTTMSTLPGTSSSSMKIKTKLNRRTEDPCRLAPLKKRKIHLDMLPPDQRDRVIQKREKNKVAAEKCRIKRREHTQEIRVQYEEYLEANEELEGQIRELREEQRVLQELLENHGCVLQTASTRS